MPVVEIAQRHMAMPEIRTKAQQLGIRPTRMKKADLIRTIQTTEGNTACFGSSGGRCGYTNCCFIGDCLRIK